MGDAMIQGSEDHQIAGAFQHSRQPPVGLLRLDTAAGVPGYHQDFTDVTGARVAQGAAGAFQPGVMAVLATEPVGVSVQAALVANAGGAPLKILHIVRVIKVIGGDTDDFLDAVAEQMSHRR